MQSKRRWMVGGIVFLLLLFALEVITTVRQESLTWDEGDHIFAGYMSWKTHDYGLNPEHPPLVKLLATIPLLHCLSACRRISTGSLKVRRTSMDVTCSSATAQSTAWKP